MQLDLVKEGYSRMRTYLEKLCSDLDWQPSFADSYRSGVNPHDSEA